MVTRWRQFSTALAASVGSAAGAIGLAGCATAVDDPALYAAGWRPVTLLAHGVVESLISPEVGLCNGDHAWSPGDPAAVVRFKSGYRFQNRSVSLAVANPAPGLVEGAAWVNLKSCRLQTDAPVLPGG